LALRAQKRRADATLSTSPCSAANFFNEMDLPGKDVNHVDPSFLALLRERQQQSTALTEIRSSMQPEIEHLPSSIPPPRRSSVGSSTHRSFASFRGSKEGTNRPAWDGAACFIPLDKIRQSESVPLDHPPVPVVPKDTNMLTARHLLHSADAASWNWVIGLRNENGPLDLAVEKKTEKLKAHRRISNQSSFFSASGYERPTSMAYASQTTGSSQPKCYLDERPYPTKDLEWSRVGHLIASAPNRTLSDWALTLCVDKYQDQFPPPPGPHYPAAPQPATHELRPPPGTTLPKTGWQRVTKIDRGWDCLPKSSRIY